MFTLKCNDYYHTSGMRMTFYTCAFLFTNFYVHASDWLNESSLSLTAIWHHLRMKDVSRPQLREKNPCEVSVCHMF